MFCMLMFKRSIILSVALFSAVSNANSLSLEVENDVAALGTLHVQLFQSELGFSQDSKDWQSLTPYQEQHIAINGQNVLVDFNDLPTAWYAVRLYVDENANQKLDLSRVGIPKEAVGFSNNPMLFGGKPKIAKTSFKLSENSKSQIKLMKDKRK